MNYTKGKNGRIYKRPSYSTDGTEKRCANCKVFKTLDNYDKSSKDGLQSCCKPCKLKLKRKSDKTYYLKNRKELKKKYRDRYLEKNPKRKEQVELLAQDKIRCRKCHKIKDLENFREEKRNTRLKNRIRTCLTCETKRAKVYSRNWRKNGFNRALDAIRVELKNLIRKNVKHGATRHLKYSIKELKKHLESQFTEGMSWENYGINGWHIDHIIPVKYVKKDGTYYWDQEALTDPSTETFHKVWGLDNLQPLWESENCAKCNRRIG